MSRLLVYTRENARVILQGAIDECPEAWHRIGFDVLRNDGRYNLALRFIRLGNRYAFSWNGGLLEVTKAAYRMAVSHARKRGVPVLLEDNTYEELW